MDEFCILLDLGFVYIIDIIVKSDFINILILILNIWIYKKLKI